MGNKRMGGDCSKCYSTTDEANNELVDGNKPTKGDKGEDRTSTTHVSGLPTDAKKDIVFVVKVQALIRGFIQRRKFAVKKTEVMSNQKYWKEEENKEPLKKKQYSA